MFIASVGESRGPGERHHAVSGQSESWPGEMSREELAYTHNLMRSGKKVKSTVKSSCFCGGTC